MSSRDGLLPAISAYPISTDARTRSLFSEKHRLDQQQEARADQASTMKFNDLGSFGRGFQLNTAIPENLRLISGNDEKKPQGIVEKANNALGPATGPNSNFTIPSKTKRKSIVIKNPAGQVITFDKSTGLPRVDAKPFPRAESSPVRAGPIVSSGSEMRSKSYPDLPTPTYTSFDVLPIWRMRSARSLEMKDRVRYPVGIQPPEPFLKTSSCGKGRQYDNLFLSQFQDVCKQKPSIDWELNMKILAETEEEKQRREEWGNMLAKMEATEKEAETHKMEQEEMNEQEIARRAMENSVRQAPANRVSCEDMLAHTQRRASEEIESSKRAEQSPDEKEALEELANFWQSLQAKGRRDERELREHPENLERMRLIWQKIARVDGVDLPLPSPKDNMDSNLHVAIEDHLGSTKVATSSNTQSAVPRDYFQALPDATQGINMDTNSSVGSSSRNQNSISTKRTRSTQATSSSTLYTEQLPLQKTITEELDVEHPETLPLLDQTPGQAQETASVLDGLSVITDDSLELNNAQKRDIINRFTRRLLACLPSRNAGNSMSLAPGPTFRAAVERFLKDFSQTVKTDAMKKSPERIASNSIRRLRMEIANAFTKSLFVESRLSTSIAVEADRVNPSERNFAEKVRSWSTSIQDDPHGIGISSDVFDCNREHSQVCSMDAATPPASVQFIPPDAVTPLASVQMAPQDAVSISTIWSDSDDEAPPDDLYPPGVDDHKVFEFLTTHPAFTGLVNRISALVTDADSTQMDMIRYCVEASIRGSDISMKDSRGSYTVRFHLHWDILGFLEHEYSAGLEQDIGQILTITGKARNAQLTTVRAYLLDHWPLHNETLLKALQRDIRERGSNDHSSGMFLTAT